MRQRDDPRGVYTPVARRCCHRCMTLAAQEMGLRILADEQGERDVRQFGEQAIEPQLSTFAPRRQVATRGAPRITVTHREDRNLRLVIKGLGIDAHPIAQALSAFIVPRNAARMHPRTRGLADDENSCRRTSLHDRARAQRQVRIAGAACAHGSQQAFERSMDLNGRSPGDLDWVRFHNLQFM